MDEFQPIRLLLLNCRTHKISLVNIYLWLLVILSFLKVFDFGKKSFARQNFESLIQTKWPVWNCFFFKYGHIPASFLFISSFSYFNNNFKNTNWKKHRWCAWLGIRTRARRIVGAGETIELWRPPSISVKLLPLTFTKANLDLNLFEWIINGLFFTLLRLFNISSSENFVY